MNLLLWILLTLVVFSLVVFVHELGHFLAARIMGMKVDEFGIGIPPRAKTLFRDTHGTLFTLNWLPIGGFVRIHGEERLPHTSPWDDTFQSKTWLQKSLVLLAWVAMNFLFAYLLFVWLFLSGAQPLGINPFPASGVTSYFLPTQREAETIGFLTFSGRIILSSLSWSIAERAGISREEYFVSMSGISMTTPECTGNTQNSCTPEKIIDEIRKWKALTFTLEDTALWRRNVTITPENGKIGSAIGYEYGGFQSDFVYEAPWLTAFSMAGKELSAQIALTWYGLRELVRKVFISQDVHDHEEAKAMVAGPIGIGSAFVYAIELHIPLSVIILFVAMISLSLGFFNLLPIPALDGGRFVTMTIVTFFSRFVRNPETLFLVERSLISLSFLLLIGLSLFIAYIDVTKLF